MYLDRIIASLQQTKLDLVLLPGFDAGALRFLMHHFIAIMSGQPLVCAVLQNAEGKQAKVYAQGSHPMLMPGAQLYDAQITMRKQGNVAFYTLDGYQVVQQAA